MLIPSPANRFAVGEGRQCDSYFQAESYGVAAGRSDLASAASCVWTISSSWVSR
jgi:hypothetical protein